MGKKFLIDTNILLGYIGNLLPEVANTLVEDIISQEFNISVINYIEVLGHSSATKDISDFLNIANRYELTEDVIRQTITLRKRVKIKSPDAVVAATALVYDFALVSRNVKDFEQIADLELINPYK
jgi:toxin FitB